jgi:ABC-type multidrug transport system ATPase subunit
MTGAYTRRDGKAAVAATMEKGLPLLPRLKDRRGSQAAYTSGGEQQMCAIGRALMANPKMVLLDEPSMGLAPQIVEEVFEIVKDLNQKEGVTFLLAEQNTNMALRYADYGYILESGRVVMDGAASALRENEDVREFYLGTGSASGERKSYQRREELQSAASAGFPEGGTMARCRCRSPEAASAGAAPAARDQGREGEERRHLLWPQRAFVISTSRTAPCSPTSRSRVAAASIAIRWRRRPSRGSWSRTRSCAPGASTTTEARR